jgi:DNA-directed RNA polymerase specialized sigma24 family protein
MVIQSLSENSNSRELNGTENIPASDPDLEMVNAERETFECINGILGKMKPVLRQAFTMTYYDELSGPEASAMLGVSAGTFKARLFRARRQLSNEAQRALEIPIRKTTTSAFLPKKNVIQPLGARASDTSQLETSYL